MNFAIVSSNSSHLHHTVNIQSIITVLPSLTFTPSPLFCHSFSSNNANLLIWWAVIVILD